MQLTQNEKSVIIGLYRQGNTVEIIYKTLHYPIDTIAEIIFNYIFN